MPVPGSQRRTVPSAPAVTTTSLFANAAATTAPLWPLSTWRGFPLAPQVRAVPSRLAVTTSPVAPNETSSTYPVWR